MNRHILRYIAEYIQERGRVATRLVDMLEKEDVLECFGFADLLDEGEKMAVRRELLELAELERFRDAHQATRRHL